MVKRIKRLKDGFAFTESLSAESHDSFQHRHFEQVLRELQELTVWMKKNKVRHNWTLNEKMSFLRNVEAVRRTGAAIRRTQLAWLAFLLGSLVGLVGLIVGVSL